MNMDRKQEFDQFLRKLNAFQTYIINRNALIAQYKRSKVNLHIPYNPF